MVLGMFFAPTLCGIHQGTVVMATSYEDAYGTGLRLRFGAAHRTTPWWRRAN
jgi:hypothetical protein